jgi:photosystem II stability/assembly factor-like uncharacterized protein
MLIRRLGAERLFKIGSNRESETVPGKWRRVLLGIGTGLLCFPLCGAWEQIGPFGGSASVIVADPHSLRTFVAGTRNALLFRSSDRGESWRPLPFPAQLRAVLNTLIIDPETRGVFLAGLSSDVPQYSGILRSTDAGASWHQVADLRGQRVRAIAYKRANSQIMAAGTESGVFMSRDGGITWRRASPADDSRLQPTVAVTFDPNLSSTLYVGTPHLPWMTSDDGVTWESIHTGMLDDSDVFSIQPDRNRSRRIFAGACSGIYRSLNGGVAWTRLPEVKDASSRTYVISQDPQHENIWFAGTASGIIGSDDGGATWTKLAPSPTRSIAFDPSHLGRILIATDGAGILRSEDNGKSWQEANHGFCNLQLSSLWTTRGEVYTASDAPGSDDVFRLVGLADSWERIAPATHDAIRMTGMFSPPWSPNLVLATSEAGLSISEDQGGNWEPIDVQGIGMGIRAFAALDPPWIAAIGKTAMFLSRDARVWKSIYPIDSGEVFGVISTRGRVLLAATSLGLRASDDLGISWRSVRGEFFANTIQAICRHPERTEQLFAAKYGGIYMSLDAGRSWGKISPDDWPIHSVKQLTILPGSPDRLMVLTQQQGVWAVSLDSVLLSAARPLSSRSSTR